MNDVFLPQDYEVPKGSGNYMKFQDGANRFRILASPILGYEWWEEKEDGTRKPVRVNMDTRIPIEDVQEPDTIKHFWAMPVWNYQDEKIQIIEITQKGIQRSLRALEKDEDWGSPLGYDIVVTKSGQKLETEYQVNPKPAKELDKKIVELFNKTSIDLEALYRGDDPFANKEVEKLVE